MDDDSQVDLDRFSFARFARHRMFVDVNRQLVERVARVGTHLVDLACGPGAVTELILAVRGSRRSVVYAVDASLAELERARERIASRVVRFIHGQAESLSRLVPPVDVVIFCNAIHLIADKLRVLGEIRKVLRPGGTLAFNTAYFKGCYVPGTERFYRYWILRALQSLRDRGLSVSRSARAQAMQWLSPDEYATLLSEAGFVDSSWDLTPIPLSAESLEDIGQYRGFVEGALPGVPVEVGAEALRAAVRQAMRDARLDGAVPRFWLQVVARAPA